MNRRFGMILAQTSVRAIAIGAASTAVAQGTQTAQPSVQELSDPQAEAPSNVTDEGDIIVTGTQIRGIEPVGSNVVSQDKEAIESLGVTDTRQVIAALPQSNFFMTLPEPGGGVILAGSLRVPIARASLRNIPGLNSSTGQRTLVLLDGKRIVPAGIEQQGVDLGIIPQGIIERTEVILDGASAVYGSDAVEGVINLITRKRFSGTEVNGRVGFADDYWQANAGITQGFSWGSGGITLNYEFAKNSNILNRDRDYTRAFNYLDFPTPQVSGSTCDTANVRASGSAGVFYSHHVEGGAIVVGPAYCDANAYATFTPAQELHSAFATFSQDLSDWLKFEVTGFYTHKVQEANAGPVTTTQTVRPTSYYYQQYNTPAPPTGLAGNQQVAFNFAPVLGYDTLISRTTLETWQVNPELTANLGQWQVRASGGYGESSVRIHQMRLDPIAVGGRVNSSSATTAINPYDIASTQNLANVAALIRPVDNLGKFTFSQARLVADGPLLTLPGGELRAAIGGEWMRTSAYRLTQDENFFTFRDPGFVTDESKSVFGEVVAPLVGADNAMPGLYRLTLSASGRYDSYKGFDSFTPKFALTYQPLEWITVRGNWGKSFRAPNAVDRLGQLESTIRNVGAIQNPTNIDPRYNFSWNASTSSLSGFRFLFLQGTDLDLRPEKATSWSIGLDLEPPVVPGLRLSATYWNIEFRDAIQPPTSGALITPAFEIPGTPSAICYPPPPQQGDQNTFPNGQRFGPLCTQAQIDAFLALAPNGPGAYATIGDDATVAALVDSRIRNLSEVFVEGVDLSASYQRPTGFGSVFGNVNVAIPIRTEQRFHAAAPLTDAIATGEPTWTLTATAGATAGGFRGQATLRHRAGFTPDPGTPRLASQRQIPGFTVVDLAFRYAFPSDNWISQDLELSLNINNVFDAHPPFSYTRTGGVINGQTLGRLFQIGFSKRFGGGS